MLRTSPPTIAQRRRRGCRQARFGTILRTPTHEPHACPLGTVSFPRCSSLRTASRQEGVAQLVEQRPFKPFVLGSSPSALSRVTCRQRAAGIVRSLDFQGYSLGRHEGSNARRGLGAGVLSCIVLTMTGGGLPPLLRCRARWPADPGTRRPGVNEAHPARTMPACNATPLAAAWRPRCTRPSDRPPPTAIAALSRLDRPSACPFVGRPVRFRLRGLRRP